MAMSFDPFTHLERLAQTAFDSSRQPRTMPVDLCREGEQYVLRADLPGVDPSSIDIDVDGHLLTIRANREMSKRDETRWLVQERPFGGYQRQFTIGDDVDTDNIRATYDNGVLEVVIPIAERSKPRKVTVESADKAQAKVLTE